jgi:hypothetical protein
MSHRVLFDFSQKGQQALERLRQRGQHETDEETIREALKRYAHYLGEVDAGNELLVLHPDHTAEPVRLELNGKPLLPKA